jgi:hypothetical protein
VDAPWKMYPIGFLFGLGFDTASEVALLGLSALTPKNGVPGALILILPLMFSCGMSLVDTLGTVHSIHHTYRYTLVDTLGTATHLFAPFPSRPSPLFGLFVSCRRYHDALGLWVGHAPPCAQAILQSLSHRSVSFHCHRRRCDRGARLHPGSALSC